MIKMLKEVVKRVINMKRWGILAETCKLREIKKEF